MKNCMCMYKKLVSNPILVSLAYKGQRSWKPDGNGLGKRRWKTWDCAVSKSNTG